MAFSFEDKLFMLKHAGPGGSYNPTQGLTGGALRAQNRHMAEGTNLGVTSPLKGESGAGKPMSKYPSQFGPNAGGTAKGSAPQAGASLVSKPKSSGGGGEGKGPASAPPKDFSGGAKKQLGSAGMGTAAAKGLGAAAGAIGQGAKGGQNAIMGGLKSFGDIAQKGMNFMSGGGFKAPASPMGMGSGKAPAAAAPSGGQKSQIPNFNMAGSISGGKADNSSYMGVKFPAVPTGKSRMGPEAMGMKPPTSINAISGAPASGPANSYMGLKFPAIKK